MSAKRACKIWGTPALYRPTYFDGEDLISPRAGGRYRITGSAQAVFEARYIEDSLAKSAISLAISDSQQMDEPLLLTVDLIKKIATGVGVRPFQKAERLLRFVARQTSALNIAGLRWGNIYGFDERDYALANAGLLNTGELEAVLDYLVRRGLCTTNISKAADEGSVWLTLEGAEHVSENSSQQMRSNKAFVAMWFSNETQLVYDHAIAPAISGLGYIPVRIDQKEHNNKIDDEIVSEIRKSRFVVADFTCGIVSNGDQSIAVARGGVYFEAGFAMGLGIPVIWSCRADLINHVHFDTRQYNHITWNDPDDFRVRLATRVGAVVGAYARS